MAYGELFPFEFFVPATPLSLSASSNSRQKWKELLRAEARKSVEELVEWPWLDERPLAMTVYYFPPAPMEGDIDNIIKPIMDALIGVVYPDDRFVERVLAQKFEPGADWLFAAPSETLTAALDSEAPVVYVRVDDDFGWRRN